MLKFQTEEVWTLSLISSNLWRYIIGDAMMGDRYKQRKFESFIGIYVDDVNGARIATNILDHG